ncbi:MAG: hypothetical protein HY905_10005 [Deltaproteobacteria bacterium]|nr:hypothetical protein [Deltaproteobacteria bacterium]
MLSLGIVASCGSASGARTADVVSADAGSVSAAAAASDVAASSAVLDLDRDFDVGGGAKPITGGAAGDVSPGDPVLRAAGISTGVGVAPAAGPRRYSGTGFGPAGKTCAGDICVSGGLGP